MLIQWCLKGIPESSGFNSVHAKQTLSQGMQSMWIVQNGSIPMSGALQAAQQALSNVALDNHVNNYAAVRTITPYISLSAGSVVPRPSGGVSVRPAWRTALDFATRGGQSSGFVFRCWTIVSPKPSATLLNISDEVRELNVFRQFWIFHNEGEVAAKLLIPCRQIEWVQKFDRRLRRIDSWTNQDFVDPEQICNLVEAVV
jgi:hypothetical protein